MLGTNEAMQQHFHIRFGPARNGWLPVTIHTANQHLAFEASFTPDDSLAQLIDALLMVLASDGTAAVTWNSEPVEYRFTLEAVADVAKLTITAFADHRREAQEGKDVLTVQTDRQVLVRSFWRSLRRLQTQDDFAQQWHRPFPHAALAQLSTTLSTSPPA